MNLWKNATRDRRAAAKAQADKETAFVRDVTFPRSLSQVFGMRCAPSRIIRDCREHSSWSAGAATSDCEAAFARGPGAGGERRQHEGSESRALRLRPNHPDEELHSKLVSEWRILRARTIRSCSSHWLAESFHPVERCTEASVATSRCARNHFGGYQLHGEELRQGWKSSYARAVGGGGRRRWLQTSLPRRGVPHGVAP